MAKAINKSSSDGFETRRMTHTADVGVGDIVVVNGCVAVAFKGASADTSTIYIVDAEIIAFPKKAGIAVKSGDKMYWDPTAGTVTNVKADGLVLCGLAHLEAAATDATVDIELMDCAPLVGAA